MCTKYTGVLYNNLTIRQAIERMKTTYIFGKYHPRRYDFIVFGKRLFNVLDFDEYMVERIVHSNLMDWQLISEIPGFEFEGI
jgi:hypothetical protein